MNTVWAIILLAAGLAILWKSAELLVTSAVGLSQQLGVSPLIIGLTVVAMGTSSPEIAASIVAALRGAGDVAVGNVYGSNIANLALVGGLAALIRPVMIQPRMLHRGIPAMLLSALLLWPVLFDKNLSRPEGAALLTAFAALMLLTIFIAKREAASELRATKPVLSVIEGYEPRGMQKTILLVLIGLVGLALGAEATVRGAVHIGERIGLSKAVIGLTIIAIGTSLPELVTCIVAAIKGHHDISIGNLVGSNVFNTLLVVGTTGAIRPFALAGRLAAADYWIMIAVTVAFVVMAGIGKRISRSDGAILLFAYLAYIFYLLAYSG